MLSVRDENSQDLDASLNQAAASTDDKLLRDFYLWIGQNFSSEAYADLQAEFLGSKLSPKFMAVCNRTSKLMRVATWLDWHNRQRLRTLDLGSGAGHMGLIANFFGHESEGIDAYAIYRPLSDFWRQKVHGHRIIAGEALPVGRFHSITSILTNYDRAWSVDDWQAFLDMIMAEHLEPGGELVIHFPGGQSAGRDYVRSRASRTENGRFLFFTKGKR